MLGQNTENTEPIENYQKKMHKVIFVRVLSLPFIIMILICGIIVYHFASYSGKQVKNNLLRTAIDHRDLIDQFLQEKSSTLKFIISSYDFNALNNQSNFSRIFKNLQTESKAFLDLGILDANGKHLAYAGPYDLIDKDYSQTDWFKEVKAKGFYISDEFLGFRNTPHFIIAVKRDEGGKIWYLRSTIDTYFFNDLVENIRIGSTGEAYLINKEGILQTRRRPEGKLMELDQESKNYIISDKTTSFSTDKNILSKYLYSAVPLKQKDWIMVVRQSFTDAYTSVAISAFIAIILTLLGGSTIIIIGYIISSKIANKLKFADIEKREIKTQLIIAGKLAEIGEMSTGIAHEINNPLQVITSEIAMIKDIVLNIEPVIKKHYPEKLILLKDSADQIDLQIKRCANITHGLLNFSRKSDGIIEPVKLQEFIPKMMKMVEQRVYIENIRIVMEIDSELPEIMSDPNKLQQVFLNLINNSIYALKEKSSREIRIHVFQEESDLVISFADNGCGFSKENIEKAFMPFFTTKPVGKGTGLGLSTVYGIIKGMGGDVSLTSELNEGSVFTIRLPIKRF